MNYLIILPVMVPVLMGLILFVIPQKVLAAKEGAKHPYAKVHILVEK